MSMSSNSNVINLADQREQKNLPAPLPPEPQVLWHINEATWVLRESSLLEEDFLTGWESQFVLSMTTWREGISPKQHAILKRIADRVEYALAKQFPPASPDDAS
jgi:hypothetical protein